jgi:DNA-binding NtrC family response regulator
MERLAQYSWSGNVRELENVIERAAILSPGPRLQIDDALFRSSPISEPADSGTLEEIERTHIIRVLQEVE